MTSLTPASPYYTPVQPKSNTCSHCWFNPRASRHTVSFYEYPCGKKHLSHQKCYQLYLKSPLTPCRMCEREFGIITSNPISKGKEEEKVVVEIKQESGLVVEKEVKSIKIKVFCIIGIVLVIGIFLFLILRR